MKNKSFGNDFLVFSIIIVVSVFSCMCIYSFAQMPEDMDVSPPLKETPVAYANLQVPFQIKAPRGWYMALAKETSARYERAIFYKYNPNIPPTGVRYNPHIMISIIPNPEKISSKEYAKNVIGASPGHKPSILEDIKVNNLIGTYSSTQSEVAKQNCTSHIYIFAVNDFIVFIQASILDVSAEEFKATVEKTVDSAKFGLPFE